MAPDGIQKKLTRVRPPRVQISYDLQVGDAIEREKLPFALDQVNDGIVRRIEPPSSLGNRRFIELNPGNFDRVLESVRPESVADEKANGIEDLKVVDPASN